MGLASNVIYFTFHPNQLILMIQWKLWHQPIHKRNEENDSKTARICFKFLDQTGRSFSPVIKELHPELLMPVCVFYLVLRGLDTIEDDTSIPLITKEPLLRNFKDYLDQTGWTFTGNRPQEKDRELLIQFDNVVAEFKNMKPSYQAIIKDVTAKMGNGMADYARKAELEDDGVKTVEDYDQYCWYVAGIVGEGLTRLFVEAGLADPDLIQRHHLYKSMGLMLQKNNIIRDIREDYDDGRRFWPREIWSKHVDDFEDLFKPENLEVALNCSSEMILNALGHAKDSLTYLAGLREQSVVNFCAIPQAMSLATLELCFRNPAVFKRNMRISKGDAFQLMVESSRNFQTVCEVFNRYVHRIQQKNNPEDPNFLKINAACEEIERFATIISQNVENAEGSIPGKASVVDKPQAQHRFSVHQKIWSDTGLTYAILAVISAFVLGASWLVGAHGKLALQLPAMGRS